MAAMFDTIKNFVFCEQKDKEGLLDCATRVKLDRDIMTSYLGGPIALAKNV